MENSLRSGLCIRPGRRADSGRLYALLHGVLNEHGLSLDRGDNDLDLANVERFYHAREGMFEVLETADRLLIGSVGVLPLTNTRCELRKLYLLPTWRGHGLGRWVLDRAICWAQERSFRYMELETASVLENATRLYESFGFRELQRDAVCVECDKHFICDLSRYQHTDHHQH